MTRDELRSLKVGDRVRWVGRGEQVNGEVVERLKGGYPRIAWQDGLTEVLNPRNSGDRARAKNIALVTATTT